MAPDSSADVPLQSISATEEHEKRKLRNRLSQRAFRRRQAESIRELRNRINADQISETEQITALQKENSCLRSQLVEVQTKLSRVLATLHSLTDSVSKALDEPASLLEDKRADEATQTSVSKSDDCNKKQKAKSPRPEPAELSETTVVSFGPSSLECLIVDEGSHTTPEINIDHGTICQQIPNIWTFEYQTGAQPYLNAINATQESSIVLGKDFIHSNSPFSDHIQVLQCLLKDKFSMMGATPDHLVPTKSLYQPVLMALSMFNSMTRPDVMAWYARTRFYHIIELTAWQLYPCTGTYERLHQRYRPTETQIKHQHPLVIDWIPFPSIRDRLIELHAANLQIDQIFCDAVSGYVVEATMADLVRGAPAIKVYVRVTDLITAMAASPNDQQFAVATLPAPDAMSLFNSPAYAAAAFKFLNMDQGASYYKIDPAFFGRYPELYDPSSPMTATGIPLKPDYQVRLTWPQPLNATTVETYRSFIHFSIDATHSISAVL